MAKINVTELRQNLPAYLAQVQRGDEIEVAVHGKVIARIIPQADRSDAARGRLAALRKQGARIVGDVVSPGAERWDAER